MSVSTETKANGKSNGAVSDGSQQDPFDSLDYPCRFEIKAMGLAGNRFNAIVQSIVTRHIGLEDLLNSQTRPSRHGKYISVTCVICARNKHQIRSIYADLAACPEVLMTL